MRRDNLARFCEGILSAMSDIHRGWGDLAPKERTIVFNRAVAVAKKITLRKPGDLDGLTLSTFNRYVCVVKRVVMFRVPLSIAKRATNQELQEARYRPREEMKGVKGTLEQKMVRAYERVKEEQVRRHTK
jgi:hypothetical protein